MDDTLLINYYYMGYELSEDNKDFPKWFETYIEKKACLLGYTDNDFGIIRSEEEILKEIKNGI